MKRWILIILSLALLAGGGYYFLSKQFEKQEREDMVWMARVVLEEIKTDKSYEDLQLDSIKYKDRELEIIFQSKSMPLDIVIDNMSIEDRNSILKMELASLITVSPHKWDSIFSVLVRAKTDLSFTTYYLWNNKYTLVIPYGEMKNFLTDEKILSAGKNFFVGRKKAEVFDYAKAHFKGDRYLRIDSLTMKKEYVSLNISYDDSKYRMGETYLDPNHINPHFTDAVGDMGSILDGMLTLCSITGYGLEFVYVGNKKHTMERCRISADKVKKLIKERRNLLWINGRKTNQVKTAIKRSKEK